MATPYFSVVIVNLNQGRYLEAALRSVFSQSCADVEVIVVDGGSTDGSLAIIQRYADRLAWWCSEHDRGQSHAFNKGFARARGRFLTWLNADDLMLPETLARAYALFARDPSCEWATGNFLRFRADGTVTECKRGPHYYPALLQRRNSPVVVFGPTSFFSRRVYESVGGVDEGLHYIMDTDLWLKFMRARVRQRRLNHYCWAFRMHEASKTAEMDDHQMPVHAKAAMQAEWRMVQARHDYAMSRTLYLVLLLCRLLDGSLVYSLFNDKFRRRFRRFPVGTAVQAPGCVR
jgi:glycosyltransferase involved in cell wall biosynthesis